jgi:hypothetical protein
LNEKKEQLRIEEEKEKKERSPFQNKLFGQKML